MIRPNPNIINLLNLLPTRLTTSPTYVLPWRHRSSSQPEHPPHQTGRNPLADQVVRPCPSTNVDDGLLGDLSAEDVLGGLVQCVQHGVVQRSGWRSPDRAGPCRRDGPLFDAVEVLRGVERSLLNAPGEDFRAGDLALRVAILRAEVDVAEL